MRTIHKTACTAQELKQANPDGFNRALELHRESVYRDGPGRQSEIWESLRRVQAIAGEHSRDNMEEVEGARALAWIENNVIGPLRISFTARNRWEKSRYRERAGHVPSCPLTGVCFDEDFLDIFRNFDPRRDSRNIWDLFASLREEAALMIEREIEDECEEEAFLDTADANGWEFDEEGNQV